MKKLDKKSLTEVSIDTGSSVAGAGVGLAIAGPPGAFLGAVVSPVASAFLRRVLTEREKNRAVIVYELAKKKIKEKVETGNGLRQDLNYDRLKELTEGTLLKAKDAYEEKKLPFIANLLATAPFTNTPVTNLNQSLIHAEQLSFRQLCIISVIGQNTNNKMGLSTEPLIKKEKLLLLNESLEGIYADINHLLVLGIIGQELSPGAGPAIASGTHLISPSLLLLLYPGKIIFNSMQLDFVDKEDIDEITEILKK